jgi:hypothetical protein
MITKMVAMTRRTKKGLSPWFIRIFPQQAVVGPELRVLTGRGSLVAVHLTLR